MLHRLILGFVVMLISTTLLACTMARPAAKGKASAGELAAARAQGKEVAETDVTNGVLKLKEYPPLPYSLQEIKYIKLLKSECGVERQVVQGPTDSPVIRAEVDAYNEVMQAEIRQKFGADILQKLREKAEEK